MFTYRRYLVRITQLDRRFINFQNSNYKLLEQVKVGQLRVVELRDCYVNIFWLRVTDINGNKVMMLLGRLELDFKLIKELPNA